MKKSAESNQTAQEMPQLRGDLKEYKEEKRKEEALGKSGMKESISDAKAISEVGGCKVEATILSIDPTLDTLNPGGACGKVPCYALIRIDKIVKRGLECGPWIVPGTELKAFFNITLSKTDSLFPDMKVHFTGLEKSNTFATAFTATSNRKDDNYQVVINQYSKIK
ncbi:MAG: hypothetical protein JKY52_11430 [Flavobacteriales bacterium]|nr:hypothetical protein [Flavobacteriales bacterium]